MTVVLALLLGDTVFKQILIVSLGIEYGSEAPCVHGYPATSENYWGSCVLCVVCGFISHKPHVFEMLVMYTIRLFVGW